VGSTIAVVAVGHLPRAVLRKVVRGNVIKLRDLKIDGGNA